ncbi:DUF4465 domain-containing protein [uncultured Alistipes sp.]|jgi:hypothetical protein|uniref:DUF4465 domain-containing protein n=1 Tax=uncultured Alistipes sp. TaxID=538949 RepID=UPI0026015D55|nr:DUF4465 domain-containing protein [uncultured Alistipes sp.]
MKKLFLLAFAAFALAACSDDKPEAPIPATGITMEQEAADILPEKTLQLAAAVTPSDTDDPIVWDSSDKTVATVSESGLVTALAPGKTTISATCGEFSDDCTIYVNELISFEAGENMVGIDDKKVALGTISLVSGKRTDIYNGVYWSKEYTEANDLRDRYDQLFFASPLFSTADGGIWFWSYYCDGTIFGSQADTWAGFVLSSTVNKTVDPAEAGMQNQFEAYADGGAGGSTIFAACYDLKTAGMAMSKDCCWPQIDFTSGPREVRSIALANSTWTYHFFEGEAGDSYGVKITGKLNDVETGSVECKLIDGANKVDNWTTFDLSSLGEVDCLVFTVMTSSKLAPVYFCVNDIILK